MRRVAACLLAAVLVLGLSGCGAPLELPASTPPPEVSAPPEKEVLPFALGYDSTASLHPISGESRINLELASLVYEGLYELDDSFAPQPVLARSAQPDASGLVWTIEIREDAVFSDGTPLTAAHVVSSLKTARKSSFYGPRLSEVTGVREKNGAVVITLSAPNGMLPALLDIPVVLEQENGIPLGTGRYRYVTGNGMLALMINGNREHWEQLPYQSIPLRDISDPDRQISAFDSGEISLVTADLSGAHTLGYSCSYEMWDYPTTNLIYVGFRAVEGSLCEAPELRRACALTFDRAAVTALLPEGHGDAACLPLSPLHPDYDRAAAAGLECNVDEAEALFSQAGYKKKDDGLLYQGRTPLKLTLLVNRDSEVKSAIAGELAAGLEQLGVTVTVRRLSWIDYVAALEKGDFDLYIGEVRLTGDFDVTQLLTGRLNYGGWTDENAPALLAAWKAGQGSERAAAAAQLWALLEQEVPIAPLCFKRECLLVRWGTVSNLKPTRSDLFRHMEEWKPVN